MPSTDLHALVERLEAASGADREIDLALATMFVPDVLVMRQRDDDSGADPYTHWQFTGSIDAALALVERVRPGWEVQLFQRRGEWGCRLRSLRFNVYSSFEHYVEDVWEEHRQATAPLAILTALLRSEIAKGGGNG